MPYNKNLTLKDEKKKPKKTKKQKATKGLIPKSPDTWVRGRHTFLGLYFFCAFNKGRMIFMKKYIISCICH
jgi:hypothetical protein